jgi:hypothetical protein
VTTAQKRGPDEEKSEFEFLSFSVLMNIHAKYQWFKSNNKKVVDLRVQYAILLRPRKRLKNQWKTKARFVMRPIYKMADLTVYGNVAPVTLTCDLKVKLLTVI